MRDINFKTPLKENDIKKLKIRDVVYIHGTLYTARDKAHARLMEYVGKNLEPPVMLNNAVLYHAGPVVRKNSGEWKIMAAGPTTSSRMNKITPEVLANYSIRLIIGKGGMNDVVTKALKKFGAVYCHYTGGAAVLAANNIKKVLQVAWLDLGVPEALWVLEVTNFGPLIVTIDSNGNSLYEEINQKINNNLKAIHHYIKR